MTANKRTAVPQLAPISAKSEKKPLRDMKVIFIADEKTIGSILADLAGRVKAINYEIEETVAGYKGNKPTTRPDYGESAAALITRILSRGRNKGVTKEELMQQFTASGRPKQSLSPQLVNMTKDGKIKKLANGSFMLTKKGK